MDDNLVFVAKITTHLDDLAAMREVAAERELAQAEAEADILAPVAGALAESRLAHDTAMVTLRANIAGLEASVKAEVVAAGASVKGTRLHAVYARGRVSWDTPGLDGYAVANPEIGTFKRVGEPSVSIRAVPS